LQRDAFAVDKFPSLERFQSDFRGRVIDVCIATEEIVGPTRNGGIASTYYHLARGLARQGHRVTVVYLKGRKVESETPEHWTKEFKTYGIDLLFLEEYGAPVLAAAERWQRRYLAFYNWLKANDRFDIVHTSEWRGGAFYCLQAKRLGLQFLDTLFIVKTSSPHIWNRHYQMQPIDEPDLLTAAFAEQKCVEWADMVVGGSAHLLSFMRHIGYLIPDGRTYAQPNIIDFSEVRVTDLRLQWSFGDVMRSRELVFFGRLEPRKGLSLFVDAINALVSRGIAPERLTFLGKEGERLSDRGGVKPLDFIAANARHWPFQVDIVTDRNQPEALSYMCQRDMIAVMPSLIENSTMAVYEALVHKIPFIATGVGGTPELVGEAFHEACLIEPTAEALAAGLERALTNGQPIATPAFDNDHNLSVWYAFHRYVAEHGIEAVAQVHAPTNASTARPHGSRVTYFGYPTDLGKASAMLEGLAAQPAGALDEAFVCLPFPLRPEERAWLEEGSAPFVRLTDAIGVSIGEAFNRAAGRSLGEILVFDASAGTRLRPGFTDTVRLALAAQPEAICSSFLEFLEDAASPDADGSRVLFLPMGGDIASQVATNAGYGVELIAMRAETQAAIGPFEPYDLASGVVHEWVTRAISLGREYYVVPEVLLDHAGREHPLTVCGSNYQYLKTKPLIDAVPLHLKKLLLLYLGRKRVATPSGAAKTAPFIWKANREAGTPAWLTNTAKLGDPVNDDLRRGPIVIGFDQRLGRLSMALWGAGSLRVTINDQLIEEEAYVGSRGVLTVRTLDVLPLFELSDRVWLKIDHRTDKSDRHRQIAFQRLEGDLYFLASSRAVYWDEAFNSAVQALNAQPLTRSRATASLEALETL
jgi:glycosyltransferase involved in cell wall biosynthesis